MPGQEISMLAMQYSFTLPADYDMSIVDRRITEKGHLIDEFPGLVMKAYLSSRKSRQDQENRYAPFYIWRGSSGLSDFICGPGFVGLTQSFGWPSVMFWSVWNAVLSGRVKEAKFATRAILQTRNYVDLAELRYRESEDAQVDVTKRGALTSISAFEPTTWTRLRFRLWGEPVPIPDGGTGYDVGYVSITGQNAKR
jgi:uncharacterized protein DUF4865